MEWDVKIAYKPNQIKPNHISIYQLYFVVRCRNQICDKEKVAEKKKRNADYGIYGSLWKVNEKSSFILDFARKVRTIFACSHRVTADYVLRQR